MNMILPVNLHRFNTTDLFHFIRLAAVLTSEKTFPWFVERFILLYTDSNHFFSDYYPYHSLAARYVYDEVLYIEPLRPATTIIESIEFTLNNNGYCQLYCDKFYIRGSRYYKKEHFSHELLVVGCRSKENIFFFIDLNVYNKLAAVHSVDAGDLSKAFLEAQKQINTMSGKSLYDKLFMELDFPAAALYVKKDIHLRQPNLNQLYNAFRCCSNDFEMQTNNRGFAADYKTGPEVFKIYAEKLCPLLLTNEKRQILTEHEHLLISLKRLIENKKGISFRLGYLMKNGLLPEDNGFVTKALSLAVKTEAAFHRLTRYSFSFETHLVKEAVEIFKDLEQCDREVTEKALGLIEQGIRSNYYSYNTKMVSKTQNKQHPETLPFLIHLFEEQAQNNPDAQAIVFHEQSLTYAELNNKANQLARYLVDAGIVRGKIAVLMADISLEMIIGVLAVFKTGATLLPIHPEIPHTRLDFILSDSKACIFLYKIKEKPRLHGLIGLDIGIGNQKIYEADAVQPDICLYPDDCAYIIYTSGTTGSPKGVAIKNSGINNSINWRKKEYALTPQDSILQLFSIVFDGFMTSFWTPIVSGSRVFLIDEIEKRNIRKIINIVIEKNITHFISLPQLFHVIIRGIKPSQVPLLRIVTLAGDKIEQQLINESRRKFPHIELVNEYGPTECSVVATCKRQLESGKKVTIGRPIAGTKIILLKEDNSLCESEESGEICIAGPGLARGYLNLPELTQKTFFFHEALPGELIYKTGDFARCLASGEYEFLGRIDNQIKIRGHRIELSEIESIAALFSGITGVVIRPDTRQDSFNRLICYFTSKDIINTKELKAYLAAKLPDYMVPFCYMRIPDFPLTPVGKIDYKALPAFGNSGIKEPALTYSAGKTERAIAAIWCKLLNLNTAAIDNETSFYELGGDSITIMQMHLAVEQSFRIKISYDNPDKLATIGQIKEYIENSIKAFSI